MNLNEYQKMTEKTATYPKEIGIAYTLFGLLGEAGEIANKYKKVFRDDGSVLTEEKRIAMIKELGDVLWYVSQLSVELGTDLDTVARNNIDNLNGRIERGTIHGSGDNR